LVELYKMQGRHMETEELYKRAVLIREEKLGPLHFDIARSLSALADFYFAQDKRAESRELNDRARAIRAGRQGREFF
jgi:hypothetical protein